jgi:serine protease Do
MEKQQELRPNGKAIKRKATSLGSGFIIDPSGYIVTNYHVIQDADEITVILHDDTNLEARVVGRDKKTDLALLKVESKKPLQAIAFGDSDEVRVGDWVVAIGNPYGLGGTVTAGIISARARNINSGPYDDYLQTDASINRGNSGGPMFNMDGEVIGVNTAIFTPTGGSIGIGFAIPSSMAKGVIEQLKNIGHTRRGWLGVRIQTVTPEIAKSLGMKEAQGALISGVTKGGPAEKAGLKLGDVVLKFDGKDVPDMHRLPRIVAETAVDKDVFVKVLRKGDMETLKVKVGELESNDEEDKLVENEEEQPAAPNGEKVKVLGLEVSPITKELRKHYDIADTTNGLVILKTEEDGLAAESGLLEGDVITEAAQRDVKTGKDLEEIAQTSKKEKKPLLLLVERGGELRFLAVSLGK